MSNNSFEQQDSWDLNNLDYLVEIYHTAIVYLVVCKNLLGIFLVDNAGVSVYRSYDLPHIFFNVFY